jgi:hypothetical protein
VKEQKPRAHGAPPTTHQRSENTSAASMVAFATVLLGGPSAVFDRLLVKVCPLECGYAHVHHVPVGSWRDPVTRPPRCAPHRRYQLEVVTVLPAVPALAGQRRRWTA